MNAEVVLEQLAILIKSKSHKSLLAYTVQQYLLLALEMGNPERVLKDPAFHTLFMDAQLATDCGYRASD